MSDWRTRWVVERDGRPRPAAENRRTVCADVPRLPRGLTFERAFLECYADIRRVCTAPAEPGLMLVAIDGAGVAVTAYVAAKADSINTAIVGRHSCCDIYLPDPALSLRHMAVVLCPRMDGQATRFRLVDLHSESGFADEYGRSHHALEANGPLLAQTGGRMLFCLPVGEGLDAQRWPENKQAAWQALPRCVHLGDAVGGGGGLAPPQWHDVWSQALDMSWGAGPAATVVRALPPPRRPHRHIGGAHERVVGRLEIIEGGRSRCVDIGEQAAAYGLLLGRYDRCDTNGLDVLGGARVSRVHALLLRIAGTTYLLDTASTNGVWVGDEQVRCLRMRSDRTVALADAGHLVRWHDVN